MSLRIRNRINDVQRAGLISLLLIVMSLGVSAPLAARNPQDAVKAPDTVESHLKKAKEAYDSQNFNLARDEARRVLKMKKDSPEANLLIALAYRNQRKIKDAIKYAQEAIKYRKDYSEAHYVLALLFFDRNDFKKGDVKQATAELDLAINQGVRYANAFALKGTLSLLARGYDDALEAYKEALKVAPADDPLLPRIRERVSALESYIEFKSHMNQGAYQRPRPLNNPMPRYTEEARQNRVQGVVVALLQIGEQGDVKAVLLTSHLGYGLDEEAIRAAAHLKFSPATKDGKPVPFWQTVQVEFNLK